MNKWLLQVLAKILTMATPEIIEDIRVMIEGLAVRAAETANPWDDIFVGMLQMLIGKPGDKTEQLNDFR